MLRSRTLSLRPTVLALLALAPLSLAPARAQAPAAPAPSLAAPAAVPSGFFTNPIIREGAHADPYMTRRNGWYYLLFTTGNRVEIWASKRMTDWTAAIKKTVWTKPATGPMSNDVWAPEAHFLDGHWYVYFTATDDSPQRDPNRRVYVLESAGEDIFGGYTARGQLKPTDADEYSIDGSLFELAGKRYFIWSGREKATGGSQNIYIAPMANPWTLSGARVRLSTPELDWEKNGWPVNEGPTILSWKGRHWLIYSASGYTTPQYSLGMLELKGADPLDAGSWAKSPQPVFMLNEGPQGSVFAVGHGCFVPSPDGTEMWNIYHGKDVRENSGRDRLLRADAVRWRLDGEPYFGAPTPRDVLIPLPSGESGAPKQAAALPIAKAN